MPSVRIKEDIKEVKGLFRALKGPAVRRAAGPAINKTVRTVNSDTIKTISRITGFKQKEIRSRLHIRRASRLRLTGEITPQRFVPNLRRFNARETATGVRANAWRKKRVYRGTFIGNQDRTVFKRIGKTRLPIRPVYGPSLRSTFASKRVERRQQVITRRRFPLEFSRTMDREIARAIRRRR